MEPDIQAYYEKEAEDVPLWGDIREIALAENLFDVLPKKFKSLIDVGCGDGYFLDYLSKRKKGLNLTAFDLSKKRLKKVKMHLPLIWAKQGNILKMPFKNESFDVVVCSEVLEHIKDYKRGLHELMRICKKYLIITVPNEHPLTAVRCPYCKKKHFLSGHFHSFKETDFYTFFSKRQMIKITKFRNMFSYNKKTLKLSKKIRMMLDKILIQLEKINLLFKPEYLLIKIKKD